ncbi:MAG: divergent PAP2 family protein [Chloroflexota bacterium]
MYNPVLIAGIISWFLAQFLKMPIEYRRSHRWDWSLLMRAGGMPSSHSALVSSITYGVGLSMGLDSPVFALAAAVAAVVIYDATGIRRQAGKHAAVINAIIADLAAGHPLKEEQLREVLGHTPLQALVGTLMGFLVAQIVWWILP